MAFLARRHSSLGVEAPLRERRVAGQDVALCCILVLNRAGDADESATAAGLGGGAARRAWVIVAAPARSARPWGRPSRGQRKPRRWGDRRGGG